MPLQINPEMSVILVTPNNYGVLRQTVRFLRAQTVRDRLEILIVAPGQENLCLEAADFRDFASYRVVEVGPITSLPQVKAQAVRVASAPVVAFGEDHSFPDPEWAEAVLNAHRQGYAAVGPLVRNANPDTRLSWVNHLLHFGAWTEPVSGGVTRQIAWHNGTFKRDCLLEYGDDLPFMLIAESNLHRDLQARGHQVYVEAGAKTNHVNISRMAAGMRHAFHGGRLFGACRARFEKWSPAKRLLHLLLMPLVPFKRLPEAIRQIDRCGLRQQLLPGILPTLFATLVLHALGEGAGYLLGIGDAEQKYVSYETQRVRHITPSDHVVVNRLCGETPA